MKYLKETKTKAKNLTDFLFPVISHDPNVIALLRGNKVENTKIGDSVVLWFCYGTIAAYVGCWVDKDPKSKDLFKYCVEQTVEIEKQLSAKYTGVVDVLKRFFINFSQAWQIILANEIKHLIKK